MTKYPSAIARSSTWTKHGERPSVLDFGAKGDGLYAYEHEAFSGALHSSAHGDLEIEVPAGLYVINDSVIFPARRSLVGRGSCHPRYGAYDPLNAALSQGVILRAGADFPAVDNTPILDCRSVNGVRIVGMEIAGDGIHSVGIATGVYGWTSTTFTDGAIDIGVDDTVFSSAASSFTELDERKPINIAGAGSAGATLYTYIDSFIDANTVKIIDPASTTVTSASGQYGLIGNGFQNMGLIQNCSITNHKTGIGLDQFSYLKVLYNNIASNVEFGLRAHISGDSEYVGNNINNNGLTYAGTNRYETAGMLFVNSTGNTIISGGKIEHNMIGLTIRSLGFQLTGIIYDANRACHLQIGNTADSVCSADVSNCRFLGGAFTTVQFPPAAIWIDAIDPDTTFGFSRLAYPTSLNITGCTFKIATKEIPFEYFQGELASATGPQTVVYGGGFGIIRMRFSGNHIDQSNTSFTFDFFNKNSRSYIVAEGNVGLLNWRTTNTPIVISYASGCRIIPTVYPTVFDLPTEGTWYLGDRIIRSDFDPNGVQPEMICITEGSIHPEIPLTGLTATISSGSNVATFNQDVGKMLAVGDVIVIAGDGVVYHRIQYINYFAWSATLYSDASTSVSGAVVTFAVPTFRSWGQLGHRTVSGSIFSTLPNFVGERILRTDDSTWYESVGDTVDDWKPVNGDNVSSNYISSTTTLGPEHTFVTADASGGSITITLPSAVTFKGKLYVVRRTTGGSGTVTVGSAAGNIKPSGMLGNGAGSVLLKQQGDTVAVISDGADWASFSYPIGWTVFSNGDIQINGAMYFDARTPNRPMKLGNSKEVSTGLIELTNSNDVTLGSITSGHVLVDNAGVIGDGGGPPVTFVGIAPGDILKAGSGNTIIAASQDDIANLLVSHSSPLVPTDIIGLDTLLNAKSDHPHIHGTSVPASHSHSIPTGSTGSSSGSSSANTSDDF